MKRRHLILLGAAVLLAAGGWAWWQRAAQQRGPIGITLTLEYSSPLSQQYFRQMVLYATKDQAPGDYSFREPKPVVDEPGRKVWSLDRGLYAGYELKLRDPLGILAPWERQVLHTDFDTLARQGRQVHLTIGGNTARVGFRKGDHKFTEDDYWHHTLVSGTARLLAPDPGAPWRLVQSSPLLSKDCSCQFALISPGDYRVELLNSAGEVMLSGPLRVPGDSEEIQHLEAEVERP